MNVLEEAIQTTLARHPEQARAVFMYASQIIDLATPEPLNGLTGEIYWDTFHNSGVIEACQACRIDALVRLGREIDGLSAQIPNWDRVAITEFVTIFRADPAFLASCGGWLTSLLQSRDHVRVLIELLDTPDLANHGLLALLKASLKL